MYDLNELKDIVERDRDERDRYVRRALKWEKMYFSQQFERNLKESIENEGKELVTLPTAFNTVQLGMRLISNSPKIECPPSEATDAADQAALKKKRFLEAMYQRVNAQQQMDVIEALKWQSMVRGRHAVEVKWILPAVPKSARKSKFPIMIRPLDPFNVGVIRGPYWTDFAYYYEEDVPRWRVRQQFPKVQLPEKTHWIAGIPVTRQEEVKCVVTDCWWTDRSTGKVWNAVIVDDVFAKNPVATDYPEVPIIEGYGDTTQAWDVALKGLSIMYPMEQTWEYLNRLTSQVATGMLWYFWPHVAVLTPEGSQIDEKIQVRPGRTKVYPAGTEVRMVQMEPNVPLARELMEQIRHVQEQSTFPGVMFGEAGSMQAGYGVNLLTQSASGRTHSFRRNLELTIENVNRIALGFVDSAQLGGKVTGGVHAWGMDDADGVYEVSLSKKEVNGFYENHVKLSSETFADEMQKIAMGVQMYKAELISADTFRNHILPFAIPSDEAKRIEVEKVLRSDEMRQKVLATTLVSYYPDIWKQLVQGTMLEPVAYQLVGEVPEGFHEMPDGTLMSDAEMMGGAPPMGMPPSPEMMGGAPPMGGPMGPPPMGPPPPGPMGPPPGAPPMMGGPMPPPLQPEAIPTAQGGGIPPEIQGQLTPEMLGLEYQLPPEIWAMMTGDPMTDQMLINEYIQRRQ